LQRQLNCSYCWWRWRTYWIQCVENYQCSLFDWKNRVSLL